MYGWYYDPTFILVFAGLILTLIASAGVKSTFARYSRVRCMSGYTGAQAAQEVLRISGIYDVRIERVAGELTDHYDRGQKCCVFQTAPMAPIPLRQYVWQHMSVVMHPASERIWTSGTSKHTGSGSQHRFQSFLADFCCRLIFSMRPLLMLGILLFGLAVIFQLVTLPVEFNASSRAIRTLRETECLEKVRSQEQKKCSERQL